jgi:hypothetical protein
LVTYVDDLIIRSSTFIEHVHHIDLVLDKITSAGFTANTAKCQFCKSEIKFLDHVISNEGVKADREGIEAVLKYLYLRTNDSCVNSWEYAPFISNSS